MCSGRYRTNENLKISHPSPNLDTQVLRLKPIELETNRHSKTKTASTRTMMVRYGMDKRPMRLSGLLTEERKPREQKVGFSYVGSGCTKEIKEIQSPTNPTVFVTGSKCNGGGMASFLDLQKTKKKFVFRRPEPNGTCDFISWLLLLIYYGNMTSDYKRVVRRRK